MVKVKFLNLDNLSTQEKDLDIVVENLQENHDLISSVVKWQLANRRGISSANTKTRGEIAMTGKKPRKQKHTGSARQGSLKGAQFVGGAKVFGPRVRDYSYELPKKVVKKALSLVLKDKISNGKLIVIEGLENLKIGTNELSKKLKSQGIDKSLVAVDNGEANDTFIKSVRNIKDIKLLRNTTSLNVYDILNHPFLLINNAVFEIIKEVL